MKKGLRVVSRKRQKNNSGEKVMKLSYSSLGAFLECPKKYLGFTNREKGYRSSDQSKLGQIIHWELSNRAAKEYGLLFEDKKPLGSPEEYKAAKEVKEKIDFNLYLRNEDQLLGTEEYLTADFEGVQLLAKVDLYGFSRYDNANLIIDWKTGWHKEDFDDLQGKFFAAVNYLQTGNESVYIKDYIKYGDRTNHRYTEAQILEFLEYIREIIPIIKEINKEDPETIVGPHCASCPFIMTCRSAKKHLPSNATDALDEIERLKKQIKNLEKFVEETCIATGCDVESTRGTRFGVRHIQYHQIKRNEQVSKKNLARFLETRGLLSKAIAADAVTVKINEEIKRVLENEHNVPTQTITRNIFKEIKEVSE